MANQKYKVCVNIIMYISLANRRKKKKKRTSSKQ